MEQINVPPQRGLCDSYALPCEGSIKAADAAQTKDALKKTAFISGKIRGLKFDNVVAQFHAKEMELRAVGFEVTNPVARIIQINHSRRRLGQEPLTDDENLREIMGICLHDLLQCDEIHMLPNWSDSSGATLERNVALHMRMRIVYH